MPHDWRETRHAPPQCPACGSMNIVHDELLTGEPSWRCRECGQEWTAEFLRPEVDRPSEG